MERILYFADRAVKFTAQQPSSEWCVVSADHTGLLRDKILKKLETCNSVAIVSDDPAATFADLASGFTAVEAAGGVVVNDRGEWLMIHRNGRWDLPKGHLEVGESLAECAAREIQEETGIAAEVIAPLCATQHAYFFPPTNRWELKTTHWFRLRALQHDGLTPQREEGIDGAVWCSPTEVAEHLRDAFPTIRAVGKAMKE